LVKLARIEREKLPDLKRGVEILGPVKPEIAHALGFNENFPVMMGTSDVQLVTIGSGAVQDFEPHVYIGTF
jgi:xylulokinase